MNSSNDSRRPASLSRTPRPGDALLRQDCDLGLVSPCGRDVIPELPILGAEPDARNSVRGPTVISVDTARWSHLEATRNHATARVSPLQPCALRAAESFGETR